MYANNTPEQTREVLNRLIALEQFSENHTMHSITLKTEGEPFKETSFETKVLLTQKELREVINLLMEMKGNDI
jgi:hypothetical protein